VASVSSSTHQTSSRQPPSLQGVENEFLFSRKRLENIARAFDISSEKMKKFKHDRWGLQNKCFKTVLRFCENNNWEKINSVRELIFGIRDASGRTVYDVLTSEEDAPPNFCTDLPENLVFQGGGPKGIAYIGTIEVLEERKIIPNEIAGSLLWRHGSLRRRRNLAINYKSNAFIFYSQLKRRKRQWSYAPYLKIPSLSMGI